jgi:hypothetical protein
MTQKTLFIIFASLAVLLVLTWTIYRPDGTDSAEATPTDAAPTQDVVVDPGAPFTTPAELQGESPPSGADREFSTDFSLHSISYADVLSGGPSKDGIPALDEPTFESVSQAAEWLRPLEPVVLVEFNGEAKAYPIQILTWHEIVNDTVGDQPVTVTFCPLCNTAIVFDRNQAGILMDFGTSGRLRNSNLIMYDRQTETWWQQASGDAIAGQLTGQRLTFLPGSIISWEAFQSAYPDGQVLSRETGFDRRYGDNPYAGYDDINSSPFLFRGEFDGKLPPMARVLTVELGDEAAAYPYDVLIEAGAANDIVGGQAIVVLWQTGTESAFRSTQPDVLYDDVGTAVSYSAEVDGQILTFSLVDGRIQDDQTQSVWTVLGEAVEGPLQGTQLTAVVGVNHFWFSWAAFRPETRIFAP